MINFCSIQGFGQAKYNWYCKRVQICLCTVYKPNAVYTPFVIYIVLAIRHELMGKICSWNKIYINDNKNKVFIYKSTINFINKIVIHIYQNVDKQRNY